MRSFARHKDARAGFEGCVYSLCAVISSIDNMRRSEVIVTRATRIQWSIKLKLVLGVSGSTTHSAVITLHTDYFTVEIGLTLPGFISF